MSYKNSFIFLVTNKEGESSVMFVRRTDKQDYNVPGGKRDHYESLELTTMEREFKEETNQEVPNIEKLNKYYYEPYESYVYYGFSNQDMKEGKVKTLNNEIDKVYRLKLKYLFYNLNGKITLNDKIKINNKPLRDSFINVTKDMLKDNDFRLFIKEMLYRI